ncbi:MAG: Crp/Fnr family transcriptional regulator [Fibrobacteria bacterium]
MTEAAAYLLMRQTLSKWVMFQDSEWALVQGVFRFRRVSKSEILLRPGQMPKHLLFVAEGLLRYYYGAGESGESNKLFLNEGMFSGPLTGCTLIPEEGCGVEALEAGSLLVAETRSFNALYDTHPVFDRLGRKLGEWWLNHKEARTRSFQRLDASERYLDFIRDHGDLAQRVPQYHIASYLGITEVSLSRIRRDLARAIAPGSRASARPAAPAFQPR